MARFFRLEIERLSPPLSPMPRFLLLALLGLSLSQCRKKTDPEPLTRLPPITQTGANTFGCLVNGQPMLPQGNDGTANYDVLYDPTFAGGSLDVRAYQLTKTQEKFISLGGSQINKPGTYLLLSGRPDAHYSDATQTASCGRYSSDSPSTYCKGTLTITRLDLTAGIVAGTFAFTLTRPGCDTIRVTEGRFDNKL